ncbi:HD domain-containing protein [Tsukamurella spumae]|uniref:Metal-dependent phosphohydrolase n=1 Tax=Tsukamurella spumae TaxID=44753 RepID=A0A846X2F9_9ACTN|nr:hypothetical protein [Tsukamurella spumae]NKY18509.1 hypothetical protein [Tsukamurella spumae]
MTAPSTALLADAQREDLLARWNEPHRRYHTVDHLAGVLRGLDELAAAGAAFDRDAVELAAWFHDAVYVIGAPDNEEQSALLAEQMLDGDLGAEVARLVRVTADHDVPAGDPDAAALCDADLAILASPPERYRTYAAAVRAEYSTVPDDLFRPGRAQVLRGLLAHAFLFHTAAGRARWEDAARANLAAELRELEA